MEASSVGLDFATTGKIALAAHPLVAVDVLQTSAIHGAICLSVALSLVVAATHKLL